MAKSDAVQHKYREILVDPTSMANFTFGQTIYEPVNSHKVDELLELTEQLMIKIKELIEQKLTDRQTEVVKKIFFEQKTQMEVADSLGLCQTTIHKILKGNIDYANGGKRYGGALKKLKKLCANDTDIQELMTKISHLRAEISDIG